VVRAGFALGTILNAMCTSDRNRPIEADEMPAEVDFTKGVRSLHHIPVGAEVFLPASIEQSVWEYDSPKAE
jgi:hypothetical protein